jgi:hypothetical protein
MKGNNEFLLSFSLIRNTRLLFASNKRFEAIDTIRLFLLINVHISHIYWFTATFGLLTLKKTISFMPKLFSDNKYVFVRTPIVMDSFFTIRFDLIVFSKSQKISKIFEFSKLS